MIENAIAAIQSLFTGKKAKSVEEKLKKDQKLKGKQIKVKDYAKLEKLNADLRKQLANAKDENQVNGLMEKYRKQRNALIAAAGVVTISLGSALLLYKKDIGNLRKQNASLGIALGFEVSKGRKQQEVIKSQDSLLKAQRRIMKSQREKAESDRIQHGDAIKKRDEQIVELTNKVSNLERSKAKAVTEVESNECKDRVKKQSSIWNTIWTSLGAQSMSR